MIHTLKYIPADALHYTLTQSLHHGNWEIRGDHSKICGKRNTIQTLEGNGFDLRVRQSLMMQILPGSENA